MIIITVLSVALLIMRFMIKAGILATIYSMKAAKIAHGTVTKAEIKVVRGVGGKTGKLGGKLAGVHVKVAKVRKKLVDNSVRVITLALRIVDIVIGLIASLWVMITIIAVVLLLAFVSSIGSFILISGDTANLTTRSTVTNNTSGGSLKIGTGKPLGITDESWNKADDVGKAVVNAAVKVVSEQPYGKLRYESPGVFGDIGGGKIFLTGIDCSGFTNLVFLMATGKDFKGREVAYEPGKFYKSASELYPIGGTNTQRNTLKNGKKLSATGDELVPGDIVINDGHTWIFVGLIKNGTKVIVHSAAQGANMWRYSNLEGEEGQDVGFGTAENQLKKSGSVVFKPSDILKQVSG